AVAKAGRAGQLRDPRDGASRSDVGCRSSWGARLTGDQPRRGPEEQVSAHVHEVGDRSRAPGRRGDARLEEHAERAERPGPRPGARQPPERFPRAPAREGRAVDRAAPRAADEVAQLRHRGARVAHRLARAGPPSEPLRGGRRAGFVDEAGAVRTHAKNRQAPRRDPPAERAVTRRGGERARLSHSGPPGVAAATPMPGPRRQAASATGRIGASASTRRPARRQKNGTSKRSAVTRVPSLSRRAQRPRRSSSTVTSATAPGRSVPTSSPSPSIRAAFAVTIGTTCSSVRPHAIRLVIADARLKRACPANMWVSGSGCEAGVPAGGGTAVLYPCMSAPSVSGTIPAAIAIRAIRKLKWEPWPTSTRSPRASASRTTGWTHPRRSTKPPGWRVNGWARMSPG